MNKAVLTVAGVVTVAAAAILVATHHPSEQPASARDAAAPVASTVSEEGVAACPVPVSGGTAAPTLSGVGARCIGSSQVIDLGASVAGRPTLLNLWAAWCGPCRDEMPVLEAYTHTAGAARVVGINLRDRPGSAVALMRDLHISYPSFTDADDAAAALAAPPVLPLSYFVDTDGSVRRLHDVTVFRDVAQIQKSVATAHQRKTQP
ncbi:MULTISPECIES: TlpA family protein disulfide reductase [Mycobacteriaceae]|uniref:TlpA family protein disulfide reductase n=1 Tax=Mycobacteriaceae TaxID=1762 RepID=UPI001CDA40F9|nr:TlpA disulfide reductase family protein [Mycobacterium sp. WUMAC-067]MCA2243397.1 TlpA family protein disulfide reductase [Mycobacterium sp. WUMAC-067]